MHPLDCPEWDYEKHPDQHLVPSRCKSLLIALRSNGIDIKKSAYDTTAHHKLMFDGLTPQGCLYFAGHYRGEKFRCLEHYTVGVLADPRVGYDPPIVSIAMADLKTVVLQAGFGALKISYEIPNTILSEEDKLYYLVIFACKVLELFLRIHPYANGNGHMGRWLVWLILAQFGYWPKKWPLDNSPPYGALISKYRDGDHEPLERFVLQAIAG